jgi:hypothetical protein
MKKEAAITSEEAQELKTALLTYIQHILLKGGGKDDEGIFSAALSVLVQEFFV